MTNNFKNRRKDDEAQMKKIMKSAIKEWMDERYAAFGKWSIRCIGVAALGILGWLIIQMNGVPWSK